MAGNPLGSDGHIDTGRDVPFRQGTWAEPEIYAGREPAGSCRNGKDHFRFVRVPRKTGLGT
jgi:hypothetical protein